MANETTTAPTNISLDDYINTLLSNDSSSAGNEQRQQCLQNEPYDTTRKIIVLYVGTVIALW